jgi:hypothetical protein
LSLPHATQLEPVQTFPLAHALPGQHGLLVPPHATHPPLVQSWLALEHEEFKAKHVPVPPVLVSQQPSLHIWPAQHGPVAVPQASQPLEVQTMVPPPQAWPAMTHVLLLGSQHPPPGHEPHPPLSCGGVASIPPSMGVAESFAASCVASFAPSCSASFPASFGDVPSTDASEPDVESAPLELASYGRLESSPTVSPSGKPPSSPPVPWRLRPQPTAHSATTAATAMGVRRTLGSCAIGVPLSSKARVLLSRA